ncbi:DUF4384 domain-containing protein [Diaphorobacter sp. HDW4B]|uniref:DUF4384 domain-containing protein n=1 Tax=Diaphorobacter sp. HDW4B TaxID=2714925 RepID=UPI00140E6D94|nr:DUF4384 domain-containing protein [Diaphorobacter sp. HDW4B]QIL73087.1 DUF4384 domain-containing protein [Diaphorobacter sp. HDW4B]
MNSVNRRLAQLTLLVASTLVAVGCQTSPPQQDRSVLLQRMDALVQGAQPDAGVRMITQPDPVVTGQTLAVEVGTNQAGYLYLYQITTDGRTLNVVFPNSMDGANYIQSGVTRLPRASWQLKAYGPAGVGYLVAVVTPQPLDLLKLQADVVQGQFGVSQAYGSAVATLREITAR